MPSQLNQAFLEEYLRRSLRLVVSGQTIGTLSLSLKENRDDQNRENIDDLDHRIDRRTGGVFVRVTDGVPGNCCLVREGTFAPKIAFLDELLGVVPRAATGSHCYRDKKAGDNRPHEQTSERDGA